MKDTLNIAFLWHMHQPYYKDILTNTVSLPWVRLHGIKDYLDMALILQDYPNIRQTFNLVPSLIDQIEDYTKSPMEIKDKFLELTKKKPSDLDNKEKEFILLNFFMSNWDRMVYPYKRYFGLLVKRGRFVPKSRISKIIKQFSDQDYLDIQAWFNLSWFDPYFVQNDPELKKLFVKGENFNEEDKNYIIKKQIDILRKIIPTYKKMQDAKNIEISITPYYHPILPLITDTAIAKECMGWAELPKRFTHPEDAKWHVKNAIKIYSEHFGKKPLGMWPAEGSVGENVLDIFIENNIKWIATDEEILLRSLKIGKSFRTYKPYLLERKGGAISMLFRDRVLSDLIGFIYQRWDPRDAVADFIKRLDKIKSDLKKEGITNGLVPIILDGENAWEYYPNDGRDFLELLYKTLNDNHSFNVTTIGDFLKDSPPRDKIEKLSPGSWINGDFAIWIGQDEKNASWEYLTKTRNDLVYFEKTLADIPKEKFELAWKEIFIAEGSDWNWWYGPHNSSGNDEEFDRLYRNHLANVYRILGKDIPKYLDIPIISMELKPLRPPKNLFTPVVDGKSTDYYEWLEAGHFDANLMGGAMHQVESIIKDIYYGFDLENLYFRLDLKIPEEYLNMKDLKIGIYIPMLQFKIDIPIDKNGVIAFSLLKWNIDRYILLNSFKTGYFSEILELGIPFKALGLKSGSELKFNIIIEKGDLILEKKPENALIKINVPSPDFESYNWHV